MDVFHWSVIISTVFSGIIIAQGCTYFNHNSDKWHLRLLIAVLIALDLVITILNSLLLRHYSTSVSGTLYFDTQIILTAVVVFLVELFFASRVYLLNKRSWYAPAIITGCAIGALVCITLLVTDNVKHNLALDLSLIQWKLEMAMANCFLIVGDLIVTVTLCWKLSISGTGVQRTQTMLHQLLLYFISRGVLVTSNQFANVIAYETTPLSLHWMPFHFLSAKLYIVTTLAILNARVSLRSKLYEDATNLSKVMTTIRFDGSRAADQHPDQHPDVESQSIAMKNIEAERSRSSDTRLIPSWFPSHYRVKPTMEHG